MTSRNIERLMGESLYQALGDEPNIELTWKILRSAIGEQLFGRSEYVIVPYIDSAIYYNQLFVFIKKREVWSTLGVLPPTYKIVGNLDYLVNRDVSTWIPTFDFSPWDVADAQKLYREYKLRIVSSGTISEKSIELSIDGAHERSAQPPVPGAMTIHTNLLEDLKHARSLYVITDVVSANYVKFKVQIGIQQKSLVFAQDMPIGFKYRKYELNSDGLVGEEIPTNIQYNTHWLKPLPQPVPAVPKWDPIRRRYTGGATSRKMKSNLTIPTPEATQRFVNLEHADVMQGAGALLPMDRRFENDDRRHFAQMRRRNGQINLNVQNRRALSLDDLEDLLQIHP